MKTTTLFILLLISIPAAFAQTYHPFPTDSATWNVVRCFYFYPSGWHDEYSITMDGTDTLYFGQTFKKLFITVHHTPGTINDTIYPTQVYGGLREESKQIYMWNAWASTDTTVNLVYDFNKRTVGDTIYTNALTGNPNPFGHIITGVDSVLVGTEYHSRVHLSDADNPYNTEYWIEGVGSSWGLPFASYWSITDNSYDLTCFYEKQQLMFANPSPAYMFCQSPLPVIICDSALTTSTPEQLAQYYSFHLYPNPASSVITADVAYPGTEDKVINIYSLPGKLVRSVPVQGKSVQLNIKDLSCGVYIIEVKSSAWQSRQKLIVQK